MNARFSSFCSITCPIWRTRSMKFYSSWFINQALTFLSDSHLKMTFTLFASSMFCITSLVLAQVFEATEISFRTVEEVGYVLNDTLVPHYHTDYDFCNETYSSYMTEAEGKLAPVSSTMGNVIGWFWSLLAKIFGWILKFFVYIEQGVGYVWMIFVFCGVYVFEATFKTIIILYQLVNHAPFPKKRYRAAIF